MAFLLRKEVNMLSKISIIGRSKIDSFFILNFVN